MPLCITTTDLTLTVDLRTLDSAGAQGVTDDILEHLRAVLSVYPGVLRAELEVRQQDIEEVSGS